MFLRASNCRAFESIRKNSTLAEKLKQAVTVGLLNDETKHADYGDGTEFGRGRRFNEMYVMPKRKLRFQLQIEQMTGRSEIVKRPRVDISERISVRRPRSEEMDVNQDWTNVWPAPRTFSSSVVPLPIRMGSRPNPATRAPFKKQGNLELIKVPNFLHLTPAAIQKHCNVIKQFCTEFPPELKGNEKVQEEVLPVKFSYSSYVHQGSSIRDNRSRVVTVTIKLSSLNLSDYAREKLIRLAGNRYDEASDVLTIVTDRCHTRKQNTDYANYLLTVLYHEANKIEEWEKLKVRSDNLKIEFEGSECKNQLVNVLKKTVDHNGLNSVIKDLGAQPSDEEITNHPKVQEFAQFWQKYRNEKESAESTRAYAKSVRQLLGIECPVSQKTISK